MSEQGLPAEVEEQAVALASIGQRIGGALVDGLLTSMVVVVPLLLGVITVDDLQSRLPPGWPSSCSSSVPSTRSCPPRGGARRWARWRSGRGW